MSSKSGSDGAHSSASVNHPNAVPVASIPPTAAAAASSMQCDSSRDDDGMPADFTSAERRSSFAAANAGTPAFVTDDDEEVSWYEESWLATTAFPRFEEIRREGRLCDVTLVTTTSGANDTAVEQRRFSAHRVVLAATVPYFRAMFCSDMLEQSQPDISLREVMDADTLEQLINFAYSGRVRISTANVQSLMVGASFLSLTNIVEACCRFLTPRLQGSNVLTVRQFASALGCESLRRAADRFLQKHFIAVARTDDFLGLTVEDLADILSRDQLYVTSEEQVFECLMRWVRHDEAHRCEETARLLACCRLPLLKPDFITDRVASDPIIRTCLRCRDLVDEAKDYHLMPDRRPLLTSFRTKPRCCNDIPGVIYAVGGLTNSGDSLSTVEMYDPMVAKWTMIEPMTTLRSRVGVAVMNGILYAIGGFNGHERLKTVEMFEPETRVWKEVTPLTHKRSALGAAVVQDRLYVCGGYDGITSLATVESYEQTTNRWSLVGCMNKQRSAAGIAVLDGKIYVMGGHDGMSIFNSVECFDPSDGGNGTWTPVKPMQHRRCRLGACALNGKLYACGGYDGSAFLKNVECYDPATDEWKTVSPMNVKRSRVSLVANCGRLYAIGGYDGISNLSSMEVYDVEKDKWDFGASMIGHEGGVGIGVVPITPTTDV